MAGFGDELRSERERQGISLEALSSETKINPRHLISLETGKYHELPGGVFRRGMVRAYLKAIAADEQTWIERFERSAAEHARVLGVSAEPDDNGWMEFAANVKRNRITGRQARDWRWFGVLIMLTVLGLSAWAVWRYEVMKLMK